MNQNDYVILFDENGSPYIAHAGLLERARGAANVAANRVQQVANQAKGIGRGVRQNHKYILKVNENGRTRYFYKQEEVKAYYEAKKRGIKNAAEYAQNAVKNKASEVANKAKQGVSTARQAIEDASGITAKRNAEASSAAAIQAKRDSAQADRVLSENRRAYAADKSRENLKRLQDSEKGAAKDFERAANASLSSAIDKRTYRNTPLGRAESEAKAAKELGSLVYDKAKGAANNTVTNAKNRFERMKSEFRDKAEQAGNAAKSAASKAADALNPVSVNYANEPQSNKRKLLNVTYSSREAEKELKEAASNAVKNTAKNAAKSAINAARTVAGTVKDTAKDLAGSDERAFRDAMRKKIDDQRANNEDVSDADIASAQGAQRVYSRTPLGMIENARNAISSAKDTSEKARTVVKDKAEDLSAKAKSTAQSVKESAQGMIENARSSTAKAVNEAWEKIPKNADGTVNPFDSNFQSAYNDWKSKKDKYDGSLAGQAKAAAEKATDSVKDMIDSARKAVTSSNSGANAARKAFKEYSENDSDFDEKNYSKENHVEDTDFYSFKRKDGKSVILEEDMKWVLPKGVDASNPTIKSALKKIANSGNFKSYDDWLENANDILGEAIEKVRDKEK